MYSMAGFPPVNTRSRSQPEHDAHTGCRDIHDRCSIPCIPKSFDNSPRVSGRFLEGA